MLAMLLLDPFGHGTAVEIGSADIIMMAGSLPVTIIQEVINEILEVRQNFASGGLALVRKPLKEVIIWLASRDLLIRKIIIA